MPDDINMHLPDEAALHGVAAALWKVLSGGLVFYFQGPVGAGKTAFIRQVLRSAGIKGAIRSPTYTLVELYTQSNLYLYHYDLYRFFDPFEWVSSGFDEFFNNASVAFIEWPEKAQGVLPPADILVAMDYAGDGRSFNATALSQKGLQCLISWKNELA